MPKVAKPLGAGGIHKLKKPGLHAVGQISGLRLRVKDTGARSWVLRTTVDGRRVDIGLGAFPEVSLAAARERATEELEKIRGGANPILQRRQTQKVAEWTFKRCADAYIAAHRSSWRNAKHAQQWENTLATYAYPVMGAKHVRDVSKSDVLACIEPYWTTKNETMVRLRNRIELVLSWAMQREYRPEGMNPARWRGNLDAALPRPSKVNNREHFEAVPIDGMHGFVKSLQAVTGTSARALEFSILTTSRTGAVRAATWDQMDLDAKVWNCPAAVMKSGRPHRVPLSPRAVELLKALPRFEAVELVFPGRSGMLSDMALTQVMRRMGLTAVPHGFRSTFSDWCAERTATPAEVREMALAHAIGNATEEAYRRGDLFDKRRALMDQWAAFIATPIPANG
jgi:integrase